jgi:hypothetical protein
MVSKILSVHLSVPRTIQNRGLFLGYIWIFSLNIFYLLRFVKWITHKLNKRMKSSPVYDVFELLLFQTRYLIY